MEQTSLNGTDESLTNSTFFKYNFKQLHCDNCGANGHDYKSCKESISSWGIILVRFNNNEMISNINVSTDIKKYDNCDEGIKLNTIKDVETISENMSAIKFLLVRRKHSLGYTEFIRGNYKKDNIDGIIYLFQQMTPKEIQNIASKKFDELWDEFWGTDTRKKMFNKKQYLESKENFDCLKQKRGVELSLDFYVNNVRPFYNVAEYGLPKGRKQRGESDIECAIREFCEETGYSQQDIKMIGNVKPIIENMVGTNGVSYRFIYYLAEDLTNNVPKICEKNSNEIGDIGFYTYDETQLLLREYHIEKKNIIKNVFMFYLNNLINKNTVFTDSKSNQSNQSNQLNQLNESSEENQQNQQNKTTELIKPKENNTNSIDVNKSNDIANFAENNKQTKILFSTDVDDF